MRGKKGRGYFSHISAAIGLCSTDGTWRGGVLNLGGKSSTVGVRGQK